MFWLVTSPHIPLLSLKLPNVGGCCSRIPSLSVGQIAIVRGKVSEPTLMKRSGESLAQLPVVAEEGTSEKAAAAAARRNETRKKTKKHFHSSALPSKPQQKVADKIRQATLQDQFLICGWSPSYQTQNSTPCVPQQMSGPSGPNSPHIPTPEISPWLTLDTQPELRFPGHDLPIFHSKFPPNISGQFPYPQPSFQQSSASLLHATQSRKTRPRASVFCSTASGSFTTPGIVTVAIQRVGTWPNLATSYI